LPSNKDDVKYQYIFHALFQGNKLFTRVNKSVKESILSCFSRYLLINPRIYFTYARMKRTPTSRRNFATEQKVGFIKVTRVATTTHYWGFIMT